MKQLEKLTSEKETSEKDHFWKGNGQHSRTWAVNTVNKSDLGPVNKSDLAVNKSDLAVSKSDLAVNTVQITTRGGCIKASLVYTWLCSVASNLCKIVS